MYSFQLALRGCKYSLGSAPDRKLPITPTLLLRMVSLLDPSNPFQAAMRVLFLVAYFSFLRKSNLVVQSASVMSPKVPRRSDFHPSPRGAFLNICATKTIQFFQRALCVPPPSIPFRLLHITFVLTQSVHQTHFFSQGRLASVIASFHFSSFFQFFSLGCRSLGLDSRAYSPHSFWHGSTTFAFACNVPAEHIKFQGDWSSDAYLVYLELSPAQKQQAVNAVATKIQQLSLNYP